MSVNINIACGISGTRTLTSGVDNYTSPTVRFAIGGSTSLTASSTPDAENALPIRLALTAGAYTIDLTALPDANGATTSLSGKKVRALYFKNRSTTNNMTFAKGASNGLATLPGTWSRELLPGHEECINLASVSTGSISDVGGSNKTIDVTGTGTDAFDFGVVIG